jgi:hypothetical protein
MRVLRDGWECSLVIEEEGIGPTYENPVRFSELEDLYHASGRLEHTRKNEIVVWILMVVFGVVTVTAFYLLWLKAGGNLGSHR